MEEKAKESKSIPTNFLGKFSLSSGFSGSLFSSIITLYALILLYFPTHFLEIVFSPVFISTGILLLALLRLGSIQRTVTESELHSVSTPTQEKNLHNLLPEDQKQVIAPAPAPTKPHSDHGSDPKPYYRDSFREWDLRAPLEVIYEEYAEGEDEDEYEEQQNDGVVDEKTERRVTCTGTYPSLSRYFPESDSDSSSDDGDYATIGNWDSPERAFFKWNEEDREELIEIALDGKRNCGGACGDDHVEEENLIEIDIFPVRC